LHLSLNAQAIYFVADRPAGSDICTWGLQTAHRRFISVQQQAFAKKGLSSQFIGNLDWCKKSWKWISSEIVIYEGHLESKERFAIKKYLLIIGNKKNMQVLSHTFTYFST
jgi:hypothetical protein